MKSKNVRSTRTPIYRDAGFLLGDIPTMQKAFVDETAHPRDPDLYIYSRYRNPTVATAEEQIMQIEEAKWSLLTQSGLAAIDVALSIFQKHGKPNRWLFFSEIYGGTNSFIDRVLVDRRGVNVFRFTPNGSSYDMSKFEEYLVEVCPDLVFFEAITNPMLIVVDGKSVIELARKHGARVIVDNTFATPFLWRPLESGADLVVHSVTKYLAGHGNLSAGVVSGNDPELGRAAIEYRKLVGHMLSPDDAYRLSDMLKTFELRFARHCSNAGIVADFLQNHPAVEQVLYPGLRHHPTHAAAVTLFQGRGYGAMVTFDLQGMDNKQKADRCNAFIHRLADSIPLVPTLGDADSILMPIEPVWGDRYPFPGMVRLSVGIESPERLIDLLDQALRTA